MRHLLLLLAAFSLAASAQDSTMEQPKFESSIAYVESVAMPKRAKVCRELDRAYAEKFDALIPAWLKAHAALISAGREELEKEAAIAGMPLEENIQRLTDIDSQLLAQAPVELRRENCDFHVESLGGR
jgi:hypothetical protein